MEETEDNDDAFRGVELVTTPDLVDRGVEDSFMGVPLEEEDVVEVVDDDDTVVERAVAAAAAASATVTAENTALLTSTS